MSDFDKLRGVRPGGKSVLGQILKKLKERPDISEQPYDYDLRQDFFTGEIKGYEDVEPEERLYKIRGKEATLISMDEVEDMIARGMKKMIVPVLDEPTASIPKELEEVSIYNHKNMTVEVDLDELRMKWEQDKWEEEEAKRAKEEVLAKMIAAAAKAAAEEYSGQETIGDALRAAILKEKPVPKQPDNTPKPECFGDWS